MNEKYIVRLTEQERNILETMVKKGKTQAYKIKHANVLLAVDADGPAWKDAECTEAFGCCLNTVHNIRKRFVIKGLDAALVRKKQTTLSRQCILDGEAQAQLTSIACSKPPKGRCKWTMQLLADKLVELEAVEAISEHTVRRALKKTNLNLTCESAG